MVNHPEQLGFKLGLKIHIGEPASITEEKREASTCDVVYVALPAEDNKPLAKGDALKVGQTGKSLKWRWQTIKRMFEPGRKLRGNEEEDRRKWLEVANGKEVSVWMKAAGKIEIPYAKGLTQSCFSTRCVEEEFLDQYYEPKLGKTLNRVAPEEVALPRASVANQQNPD
jgi:hypothetical protein